MLRSLIALALFVGSIGAQCLTHPFPGVVGVVGVPSQGCNEISNGPVPWLSINAAPNAATGGNFSFVWNQIPDYATAPATYQSFIAIDTIQPPPFQFPGTTLPGCKFVVLPNIFITNLIVLVGPGCQSVFWTNLPPLPAFQGLGLFCQGALWDLTQNKFAVTRPFAFQFQ
jgi:hypothetical protein